MAPASSIKFIDTALSCTSPYALSYPDPKQKWLIRKHLLSLIQDYPIFTPSTDTFTHNDGTSVNLLNATGNLRVSRYTPPIPLTIWVHENYPYMPPLVFVLANSMTPIHRDHPFVDLSGSTSSPYLQTWLFPRCNLTNLVRKLVKIFTHDHPFIYNSPVAGFSHPSLVSRMEALDRLSGMLHYDMMAFLAKNEEEVENLSKLQEELIKRDTIIRNMISSLEQERSSLKDNVTKLTDEADVVMNWLRVNDANSVAVGGDEMEEAFEAADEESKLNIECLSGDRAIEDLIYALDKAVEEGTVPFDAYIKQVRALAREQFYSRAMLVELAKGRHLFSWLPIIEPDPGHTKLRLSSDGLEAIRRITTPIAAVAVIGTYCCGKSFLLNQLLSLSYYEGFGVGHMRDTKTKGIWVWGTPVKLDINGVKTSVFYIDTEGFESVGKSNVYDDRIFALATVLSSVLIYNLPEMGKEIINSDSNGVTSIQSITLGVFSPTPEAINTDAWIKDEDEQNFEEKISRSLKHFNSQSDGNNDQDPTLSLNSSIRDGCLEEESFGIQDDTRINSADKNIEILKGEDMEVYEEEKYWNLGGSIFELRSCNHMILKENEFEIWRRQRGKINCLSRDDCIGNLCCNDKVNCKSVMRFDNKNSAESIFPFTENVKEKYEMASIYGWKSSEGKSVQEMLNEALQRVPNNDGDKNIDQVNQIQESLAIMGDNSTSFSLPQPHLQRTKLCDMKDDALDPVYVKRRDYLVSLYVKFREWKREKGEKPCMKGRFHQRDLWWRFSTRVFEQCLKLYSETMVKLSLPLPEQSLQDAHERSRGEAMKSFDEQHFGRNRAKRSFMQLEEEIDKPYKNVILANDYQSAKLCEALYVRCEDKMDQLQVLRLPSMAKFNAGLLQCSQSFEQECVGPSKANYEQRMMKMGSANRFCSVNFGNLLALLWQKETSVAMAIASVQQS
ncbi:hypothetical protein GH714_026029 [Hevea brasiliensis]|uniref:GB1/RHD3-type G domain-containing protein n=1 Tax=Hevea brasiliensis TaxID=3981 RepID=A0A6A6NJA7_HEVBR|nr:hypothetical protein GH714_026029 [Hevea brasiliensis]